MKLGSWLLARGKISGVQLKRALLDQSFYGGHLSTSLIKLGHLDESTLGEYLSDVFQMPFADSSRFQTVDPEVLRMIPRQLAEKHQIIPLALEGRKLQLAMMKPRDLLVVDEVSFLTGLQVEPWVSSENNLLTALEQYYQIPRSERETIPLADSVEDEFPADRPRTESLGRTVPARQVPATAPASGQEEMGLDGRPLSAPAELSDATNDPAPETSPPNLPSGTIPRSIQDWRDQAQMEEDQPESPPADHAADSTQPLPSSPNPSQAPSLSSKVSDSLEKQRRPTPLTALPTPVPTTIEEVTQRLRDSHDRDVIFDSLLGFCSQNFLRTALFVVMQDKVIGWSGRGDGFERDRIRSVSIPFSVPSIFSYFRMGSEFYFGPVPNLPVNKKFYSDLSVSTPDRVLLVPIFIKDRLIAIFYGDNGASQREEPDIALYRRLAQKAALALEILILRNKIEMI